MRPGIEDATAASRRPLFALRERDDELVAVERHRTAERPDEPNANGGAEILQLLAEHDAGGTGGDRADTHLRAGDAQRHRLDTPMPERRDSKLRQRPLHRVDVHDDLAPVAGRGDRLASGLGGRARERERVGLAHHGVIATVFDSRSEAEQIENLRELGRRFVDHPEIARRGLGQLNGSQQRLREPLHCCERRAQVVSSEGDQPGEVGLGQGGC